ncbi:T9SS type A sorting domain-containing protein [Chryseobacterium scophthalmum]|uniref:T9SS type A sorting domain-containing protein n=1 Tax=Chryseobacterium scophthalmum TaxID=59733 RepID=UPI001AEBF834|nr:T9SS type A sorting domain-containing protein [Chryseobacterium scophthalmum]
MKKLFLILSSMLCSIVLSGQILVAEDFNTLTIGELGACPGVTPGTCSGQGGFYTHQGQYVDYQIIDSGTAYGKSLKMISGAGHDSNVQHPNANPNNRYAYKGIVTSTQAADNDIVTGGIEFFTGAATGKGMMIFEVSDGGGTQVAGIGYDLETKKIVGRGIMKVNDSTKIYLEKIPLGDQATYAPNMWVPVSFVYNKITGRFIWTTPEGDFEFSNPNNQYQFSPGETPYILYYGFETATGNTIANEAVFDNANVVFRKDVLAVNDSSVKKSRTMIYPNPATDYLEIQTESNVNSVEIYDMSGRKENTEVNNNRINISNLTPGNYLLKIKTSNETITKKFIKK